MEFFLQLVITGITRAPRWKDDNGQVRNQTDKSAHPLLFGVVRCNPSLAISQ
jgi:hypothetical protein